ncbi:MAG TPA: hypothetical protein VGH98_18365 [Gemmatimonadaceae bacterium]|jgi:hypothetical protein
MNSERTTTVQTRHPPLLTIVAAWILLGILIAFFQRPIWDAIWVLALGVWPLYALAGVALLVVAALRARAGARDARAAIALILLAGIGLWFGEARIAWIGDEWVFKLHFARMRAEYERIVAEVQRQPAGDTTSEGALHGVRYQIDRGPPMRVAFLQPGGMLDNWEGVVYDPTGAVASATGWQQGVAGRFSAPPNVRVLFGGDLVGCERIENAFYRCWFT